RSAFALALFSARQTRLAADGAVPRPDTRCGADLRREPLDAALSRVLRRRSGLALLQETSRSGDREPRWRSCSPDDGLGSNPLRVARPGRRAAVGSPSFLGEAASFDLIPERGGGARGGCVPSRPARCREIDCAAVLVLAGE